MSKKVAQTDIALYRLASQQLAGSDMRTGHEMVSHFGAMQAQEYVQTKWGLGLRLPHLLDKDIEQELNEGKILRTHLLRPTWHFVANQDIEWMLQLTAPRVHAANNSMCRKVGLDAPSLHKYANAIGKLLQGGNCLTRNQITESLFGARAATSTMYMAYVMMYAELEGVVCSGPRQGNQLTYALLSERVGKSLKFTREEALHELALRYFTARGPATVHDFATWSGLTLTDCRLAVNLLDNKLQSLRLEEKDYYFLSTLSFPSVKPQLLLLPEFDELIMGYKNREAYMQRFDITGKVLTSDRICTMMHNGQCIGLYRRTLGAKSADFEIRAFMPLGESEEVLLQKQLKRFGEFTGLKVSHRIALS